MTIVQLEELVEEKVKGLICLGKDNKGLIDFFTGKANRICRGRQCQKGPWEVAHDWAQPGEVVLLSPACSSFDLFDNYEEPGR